jgi:hypothetical protein
VRRRALSAALGGPAAFGRLVGGPLLARALSGALGVLPPARRVPVVVLILGRDAGHREQRVPAGVGDRRAHLLRLGQVQRVVAGLVSPDGTCVRV